MTGDSRLWAITGSPASIASWLGSAASLTVPLNVPSEATLPLKAKLARSWPAWVRVADPVSAPAHLSGAQTAVIAGGRHDILNDVTHRSVAATIVLFLERLRHGADIVV